MKIVKTSTPGGQGPAGATWWSGTGAPANTLGSSGDFYVDPTNFVFYGPKASGAWPSGTSFKGSNGATWRTGSGAPSNALGVDGDLYLDTATSNVWQRESGAYSIIDNIKGASGAAGATGPRGISDRIIGAGRGFIQLTQASPDLSNGTDTGCNAIEPVFLPDGGADIRICLSNINGTGPVTRTASFQWPANFTPQPFTFSGSNSVTIPAGQVVWSDPFLGAGNIGSAPPPGTEGFIRHFLSCASGVRFELMTSSGGGQVSGTTQTDQTLNYTFNYGTGGGAQIGIANVVGSPLVPSLKSLCAVGDSIFRGEGDSVAGGTSFGDNGPIYWAAGGFAANANPWANCAIVGEEGASFVANATTRRQIYLKYADVIAILYGTNDIGYSSGSISLASLQAIMLKAWWACNGFGAKVIGCTLPPRSISSNNFIDVPGQTPVAGWGPGSVAALYSAWVRAGAPIVNGVAVAIGTSGAIVAGQPGHPLTVVCDVASVCEAGVGSGVWVVNGTANYATPEGTHMADPIAQLVGALMKAIIATL